MQIFVRLMVATLVLWGSAAQAAESYFNIPPQPLSEALVKLSEQADTLIMVPQELVKGKRAPEVRGTMSVQEALDRLLEGSGLKAAEGDKGGITILEAGIAENEPVDDASSNRVVLGEEPKSSSDSASVESGGQSEKLEELQEIVVTGTRFEGRTGLTSPVPVDIVSAENLRAGGRTELAESLSVQVPALSFEPVAVASNASALRPFSYRGLPPEQLLVLVNGKRWHLSMLASKSYFDFNSIPPTAIDHVEVLRDGASAQYGSDAIAGVVNLFLRRDAGADFMATTGQYYEGDGNTTEFGLDHGWQFANGGFLHLSAYHRQSDPTNRQGTDPTQQYFDGDPREATGVDRNDNYGIGNAEREEAGFSFNFETPQSERFSGYAFGGYSQRTAETKLLWRNPNGDNNVRAIYPDGYAPFLDVHISDLNAAAGIRGEMAGWNWDLSQAYGFSRLKNHMDNSVNVSFGAESPTSFYLGLDRVAQATTNLDLRRGFDAGLNAPLRVAVGSEFRHESWDSESGEPASYSHGGVPILDGPNAGGIAPLGSQGQGGYRPDEVGSESRHSIGAYIDLENQLTERLLLTAASRYEHYSDFGSTVNGKLSFLMQLASRFALRGSASTGFRAPSLTESNFSQSFSDFFPELGEPELGEFLITRQFAVSSPVAVLLGAKPLEPEKSRSFSLGSTLALDSGLNFTFDVYRTYVDDAIVTTAAFTGPDLTAFLTANGFPNINAAYYAINGVDKRVDGADFTAAYAGKFGKGKRLDLSAAVNWNRPKVLKVSATPPEAAALSPVPILDAAGIDRVEKGTPRTRVNLSATYHIGDWRLLLRGTRYGSMRWLSYAPPDTTENYGGEWVADIETAYDVTKSLTVALGAQNLFDNYPKALKAANDFEGGILHYPYSGIGAPFGMSGGFYYARLRLKL